MALDLEQALTFKLKNTAAIQAICGTRVYPQTLPPTVTLPAISYQLVSAPIEATHDEIAGASLAHPVYQFDAWATTYQGAAALSAAVHTALHGYKGTIASGADSYVVQSVLRVAKRADRDADTGLYWRSQDYEIFGIE